MWVSFLANTYGWDQERSSCDRARDLWKLKSTELRKVMRYSQKFFNHMLENSHIRNLFSNTKIGHTVVGATKNWSSEYNVDESNFVEEIRRVVDKHKIRWFGPIDSAALRNYRYIEESTWDGIAIICQSMKSDLFENAIRREFNQCELKERNNEQINGKYGDKLP